MDEQLRRLRAEAQRLAQGKPGGTVNARMLLRLLVLFDWYCVMYRDVRHERN
jgi:hypothetical protein